MGMRMPAIITNLRSMRGMGIFAERSAGSQSLEFRRFNLIYGFNGSGKSTLSRLFASLQSGAPHPKMPAGCSFEVALDDETSFKCPGNLLGLEKRIQVYNSDYVEQNIHWAEGRASPVFFIGANQVDAAAELEKIEAQIAKQTETKNSALAAEKEADKAFVNYKKERAKLIASHLHLSGRKYEAPALAKDYDKWKMDGASALSDAELKAAEDTRRLDEPMPPLSPLELDASDIEAAYQFISEICGQSLTTVALEEARRYPEMLVWLKTGQEFHDRYKVENCLFCGNAITGERRSLLTTALDNKIDEFVARIELAEERRRGAFSTLVRVEGATPSSDAFANEMRTDFKSIRESSIRNLHRIRDAFGSLQDVLRHKRERPANPADLSGVLPQSEVAIILGELGKSVDAMNALIVAHNNYVDNFVKHKEDAEIAIRRHFIIECRMEYGNYSKILGDAGERRLVSSGELDRLTSHAGELRQRIKEHGPAAEVINKLISSYLGHQEIAIQPVEQGYQLLRHGQPIQGTPSEGEKTAIAISYFLSSLEAEGRKLKNLIVIVDDPVSSLDSRALNYACALVRNRLKDVGQLFVLTHNLQCMGEFRKAWKHLARRDDKREPTATLHYIDVAVSNGQNRRSSKIVQMPALLRDYESEYHYLFSHVIKFAKSKNNDYEHGYMIPNVLRRVMDVFLAFKYPDNSPLKNKIDKLCRECESLNQDRLVALERLSQFESHSDNLDDLLSFSPMTVEESREAATALLEMMEVVDGNHLARMKKLCH